ncbi:MAG TPA: hypothetical protein VD996_16450 [Chitinophagaceae bacterium]|nr:hypothetical protein [Chitinophagaceae bacterium]
MRTLLVICLLLPAFVAFAQPSFAEWEKESKTNKRLLPRYGHLPKSQQEIDSDSSFIKEIMSQPQFKTRRDASNHLIGLGFRYYYRPDFKTAMYRFNQAYLLDSTNTDIFWGYGAIYMAMGQYDLAKQQYDLGLTMEPNNTHLLTDMATYYMQQFYGLQEMPANDMVKDPRAASRVHMDSALVYLNRSYKIDPNDVNTAYKLSICYWNINDCVNAWKYYDVCMALGGRPVTEAYTRDLKKRCPR